MKKKSKKKAIKAVPAPRKVSGLDLAVLLSAALLLIERLPRGIMMQFAGGPDGSDVYIEYCSYFDFLPFGYGDFFPLITAWLTVVITLVLLACRVWKKEKLREAALLLAYLAFGTALVALFMCIRFTRLTFIRAAIPALLFILIQLLHKYRTE